MKKISLFLCVVTCLSFLALQNASAEVDLKSSALKKLQSAAIKALPAKSNYSRIAVLDFENDDGTVRNSITSAITEKTDFKVIERSDLDKILTEQGLQLKDILDEKSRITHGKIRGVQGLLFGRVDSSEAGFMSYTIKVNMKLDDVEKGEIVVSKDLYVTAVSPVRSWLIYGVAGIIVLIVLLVVFGRTRKTVIKTEVLADVKARVDLTKEVGRAISSISEAKAKLMEKGLTDDAVRLKDAEREMLLLKEHADNAARGSADLRALKEFKNALDSDRNVMSNFTRLTESAERLCELVISGNIENFEREVDLLKRDIRSAMNEFSRRGI
jgi:hypothetical protein